MSLTLLDRIHLSVQCVGARLREQRRWSNELRHDGINVYYGFDRVPGADGAIACGGAIKLLDLLSVFPNTPRGGNILYLVSSALPIEAVYMARQARMAGAKVVVNQNGVGYPAWHGPGWERFNRPLGELLNSADYVFYQSEFCRQSADRYLGAARCPSDVLHNPVDTRVFVPPTENNDPSKETILLLAGSHGQIYRLSSAIEALAEVRQKGIPARLIIAGRFYWHRDERKCIEEIMVFGRRMGVDSHIEWIGAYSQAEAVKIFQRAHILVHPVYNDACPRLVVEAMACGLPVVYSSSGGVPELVGPDAGVGIPAPQDWEQMHPPAPREMADAVIRLCVDWNSHSKAARERAVSALDVVPWIERHRIVFERLLA